MQESLLIKLPVIIGDLFLLNLSWIFALTLFPQPAYVAHSLEIFACLNICFIPGLSWFGVILSSRIVPYEEIIRRVYREPSANRFLASLAPFVRSRMECPEIREMVSQAFREFARRNLKRYPAGLTVACLGGIAAHFEQPLREALADEGFRVGTIVESPAQGLIRYHHGEANYGTEFRIR